MKVVLLAAAAVLAAPAAQAADFAGLRVEARAGWDRVSVDGLPGSTVVANTSADEDGIAYGVGLGYDYAVSPNVIVGLDAGIDLFDTKFSGRTGTVAYDVKARRDIEVAARLGTKLGENVLLYGKVGYSNAGVRTRLNVTGTTGTTGTTTIVSNDEGDGVRLGGGLELALIDNVYAKAEYRYTNYEAGVSRNQVLTGIGVRF